MMMDQLTKKMIQSVESVARSRVLDKLTVTRPVKKFHSFKGTRNFVTNHSTLSEAV